MGDAGQTRRLADGSELDLRGQMTLIFQVELSSRYSAAEVTVEANLAKFPQVVMRKMEPPRAQLASMLHRASQKALKKEETGTMQAVAQVRERLHRLAHTDPGTLCTATDWSGANALHCLS